MRLGVTGFRALLCVGWAILLWVSIRAVAAMGLGTAGTVFISDFGHPWRAQFNTDFTLHLLLMAAWMIYRSKNWVVGVVCAVLTMNLGGMFTLAYVLVVSIQAKGDIRKLLLGSRFPAVA
jgi:hypothetical protein